MIMYTSQVIDQAQITKVCPTVNVGFQNEISAFKLKHHNTTMYRGLSNPEQ